MRRFSLWLAILLLTCAPALGHPSLDTEVVEAWTDVVRRVELVESDIFERGDVLCPVVTHKHKKVYEDGERVWAWIEWEEGGQPKVIVAMTRREFRRGANDVGYLLRHEMLHWIFKHLKDNYFAFCFLHCGDEHGWIAGILNDYEEIDE